MSKKKLLKEKALKELREVEEELNKKFESVMDFRYWHIELVLDKLLKKGGK